MSFDVRQVDAALFDMDGTLIDSMWMWRQIDIDYLARFGIELPEDLQESIAGMSFSETAVYFKERFELEDDLETIKNDWNDMAHYKYTHDVPLKAGVMEFLLDLKAKGIRTGIATSNSSTLAYAVLDSLKVRELFDTVVTACEVGRGKPAPDIYLEAAERLSVLPERAVVFEDIVQGLRAGKAAGMRTVAVEDEYSRSQREEKKAEADYFIEDFSRIRLFRDREEDI